MHIYLNSILQNVIPIRFETTEPKGLFPLPLRVAFRRRNATRSGNGNRPLAFFEEVAPRRRRKRRKKERKRTTTT